MNFLRVANESQYPEIRAAAIEIAKSESKYQHKQGARVPPTLVLILNITLGIAAVLACWYAFLHYKTFLAIELSSISILLFLVIVGSSLFLSGHLSQANFMKILSWPVAHIKTWFSRKASGDGPAGYRTD